MVRSILLIFLVLTLSEIFALLNSLLHLPLSFLTVDILLLKTGSLDACIASKKFFFLNDVEIKAQKGEVSVPKAAYTDCGSFRRLSLP